jgi:nicotinamidase-related amidase
MSEELIDKWIEVRKSMAPEIDPKNSALLIIDMQEYQVRKEWPPYKLANTMVPGIFDYFSEQVSNVAEPNIIRLIDLFREKKIKIIYTMFSSFNDDGSDLAEQLKRFNEMAKEQFGDVVFPPKDHPGSKIIDSIKPHSEDFVVIKNTSGVFTATNLEIFLYNMGIKQLFVVGVVTNMCVEGSARIGSEYGFDVFIIDDACAAWTPETHKNTLRSFQMMFGYVMTTDEAIKKIKERANFKTFEPALTK